MNDLKLIRQVLDTNQCDEFIKSINYFIKEGEIQRFKKYFKKFYTNNKDGYFWNTHYLTSSRNQKQGNLN
ncbi:MAG: hypothetical protein ACFFBH_12065 [Promethearchaeota archaeon]